MEVARHRKRARHSHRSRRCRLKRWCAPVQKSVWEIDAKYNADSGKRIFRTTLVVWSFSLRVAAGRPRRSLITPDAKLQRNLASSSDVATRFSSEWTSRQIRHSPDLGRGRDGRRLHAYDPDKRVVALRDPRRPALAEGMRRSDGAIPPEARRGRLNHRLVAIYASTRCVHRVHRDGAVAPAKQPEGGEAVRGERFTIDDVVRLMAQILDALEIRTVRRTSRCEPATCFCRRGVVKVADFAWAHRLVEPQQDGSVW